MAFASQNQANNNNNKRANTEWLCARVDAIEACDGVNRNKRIKWKIMK